MMNTQPNTFARKPELFLSALDFERLEAIADSLPSSTQAMKEAFLEELARASVVSPEDIPSDTVTMNSIVRFQLDGREFCKTLVYPRDAVDAEHQISIITPVGMALIGMQSGAAMQWPKPGGGALQVKVLEVLYQPENSGAYHR
jgi:regulator of nucleoside diphosphate kinase